ncbi:MAG: hypothetical protein D6766_01215 [Verrucomicrobia bacterium]|nr:MAG: hypothetical protein D6766_01215 [Verrucomicrobiota bacterium]
MISGIAGGFIGVAGGLIGTYFSIKNTNGPRERAFVVRSATVCWVAVLVFLGLLFALPHPYRWFLWVPYAILLAFGIVTVNRTQRRIREEESRNQTMQPDADTSRR